MSLPYLALTLMAFWPLRIGDEIIPKQARSKTIKKEKKKESYRFQAAKSKLPTLVANPKVAFDHKGFLALLSDAGSGVGSCLETWQTSPAKAVFRSHVSAQGRILNTVVVGQQDLPLCLSKILEKCNLHPFMQRPYKRVQIVYQLRW